jgi:tetratricopeptide (TPR) repeat protein
MKWIFLLLPLYVSCLYAAESDPAVYEQSIKSTKQSIDREMIDVLYHDAMDAYREQHYAEALELLDKIYSLDPQYEDVAKLRVTIRKTQTEKESEVTSSDVHSLMNKGSKAYNAGQTMLAINYWKQALGINPNYAPAQKKILEANQRLAKKEFEMGYIHYHHGESEDALESWSNAIALDPTYKQRGLLLLMSKIQLQVRNDQIARLAAQGFDQYQQGQMEDALHSYQELSAIEPRHEEARRMTAKIKIQLGKTAIKAAQRALTAHDYTEAIGQADKAIQCNYEISRAQAMKSKAESAQRSASEPKVVKKPSKKPAVEVSTPAASAAPETPAPPVQAANPEEAQEHYRKGLSAMRAKDYHLAMQELDEAAGLDPTNEHIYVARQRAQQEWAAASNGASGTNP